MAFPNFIGNAEIVRSLRQMVTENRLPQTLLFAGPRGVGKATLARFLTAAMNCQVSPGDPCGECSNCKRSWPPISRSTASRKCSPSAKR